MIYLRDALTGECVKLSLLALRSKAYLDYNENFLEACREDLTLTEDYIETNHVYIFEKDEEIIGFFSFVKAKTNRLDFLYLAPDYVGIGYGKVIWDHIVQQARKLEITRITIDSDPNAKGFYEKMGAVQIGEVSSTVFESRLLPLMEYTFEK